MASAPLPPATRRLVGFLLMLSGGLLGLGMLLKVYVTVMSWNTTYQSSYAMLSVYLVGLLASGLLMRLGRRMRRGDDLSRRDPDTEEIL
ncbi:hypothetical protein [Hymenobacter properus]|uniref:Uncharacterized protein n=1 Tax=Hymenobacter properus TaxID=2791026 RepID=A0A931FKM7_9BACT|nr:hypothetical protein [Hymenobacter properus]MBF9143233.1 hypothetical protein [Hymenobacter properus]MBR7722043.1 hypothetical protein [Microvirga sp. SRT04]